MEELLGFLVCAGILIGAVCLPIWLALLTRQSNALQHIGSRYGAKATNDHAFARARLKFVYGQTLVQIRYIRRMRSAGGKQTEVKVKVPYQGVRQEARCRRPLSFRASANGPADRRLRRTA